MNFNIQDYPTCEGCPIFLKADQVRYEQRSILCEGVRASGKCPKDEWFKGFEKELREILKDCQESKPAWLWAQKANFIDEVLGTETFRPPIIDGQPPDKRFKLSQTKRGKLKLKEISGEEPKIKEEIEK